jgi:hypothetical protein
MAPWPDFLASCPNPQTPMGSEQCRLGDIDADGDADVVAFVPADGQVWVADAFPNP